MRRIYPTKLPIRPDGGLNNKFAPALIADNESPDCLNVIYGDGAVGTRGGSSKLNTASVGSFVCDGIYTRHDQTGAETMCAWFGGSMWTVNVTSGVTVPSAVSVWTAGQRVASSEYQNQIFFGNGGSIPMKWNGTDFTRHGVYPPTTTATVATAPTGVGRTGSFSYKYTYVNSYSVESDVGPVTNTHTLNNENARITSIPVAPQSFGVNARRIYRTTNGGTSYKLLTTISDNTTTTYDDAVADASLGATAPTDNGVPPLYNSIVYHQNRLFALDPSNLNYVKWSEFGEPHTWKTTSFKKVGDNTSDLARGLAVYDNQVYVVCDQSKFLLYATDWSDSSTFDLVKVKGAYGSKSPFCLIDVKDGLLFAAMQNDKFVGFGLVQGATQKTDATLLTVNTVGSDLISNRIEPDMFDVNDTYLGNISGTVYKNRAYITLTKGSNSTTNNRVYVYDFSIDNITKQQKAVWSPYTGWNAAQFTIWNGSLYFGSSTATGFIYQAETSSYNDDGAAINSYYWTKEFSGYEGEYSYNKDYRYARLLVDLPGAYYMNCAYKTDSDDSDGTNIQIDLTPGGSLWGVMVWGVSSWGGGALRAEKEIKIGGARGKRIQFKFSNQNTVNQMFKVHWYSFAYNLKGFR